MAGKANAVSVGAVNERRLRPVYEHLDNGNNKSALHEAEKVLKKQKDLSAAKVLKTIALHRLGRTVEAFSLSQEIAVIGPTDDNSLQGLTLYYREIQRPDLICPLYEVAIAKCPGNEEYMTHLFMSYVRMGRPKEMQRVAIALFKHHAKNPYLFWGVMSIVMQADENEQLGKTMFLPLAEKMIEKHVEKGKLEADAEIRLYLMILNMLGKHEKELTVLETQMPGHSEFPEMKAEILKKLEKWEKVNDWSKKLLKKEPDVWNHVLDYLESLEKLIETGWNPQISDAGSSSEDPDHTWEQAVQLFKEMKVVEITVVRPRRGPFLACMELHRRLTLAKESDSSLSTIIEELSDPVSAVLEYANYFATKPCCFTDTQPSVRLFTQDEKEKFLEEVAKRISEFSINGDSTEEQNSSGDAESTESQKDDKMKENEILKHLFYLKMQRYLGHHDTLETDEKLKLVEDLLKCYSKGLKFSMYRPSTDLRTVDDYSLMAANILIDLHREEENVEFLWRAIFLLELTKQRSVVNFKVKMTLIRLYCEVAVFMPCAQIYDSLDIKHMQQDSIAYLISNSVSTLGHYQLASQAFEASRAFFLSNDKDSLEVLITCFRNGTFHKVSEFTSFRKQVKNSFQAAGTIAEHTYMDFVTQADIDIPYYDLIESCCLPKDITVFDDLNDNRDFTLQFDWAPDGRSLTKDEIATSFSLERKWVRYREMQVRTIIELMKNVMNPTTSKEGNELAKLNKLLDQLQEIVEEMKSDSELDVKFPFHGPPRPKSILARDTSYPQITLHLFRLFQKMLDSKPENELKLISDSVIAGIKESLAGTGLVPDDFDTTTKSLNKSLEHNQQNGDSVNRITSVTTSPEPSVTSAMEMAVPDVLKSLDRKRIEWLVLTCEMFSLTVLLVFNYSPQIVELKTECMKKRRKKKGKQEPLPPIIQFYRDFVSDLKKVGEGIESAVRELQSGAETMTIDLSKMDLEPKDNLSNGDINSMQNSDESTPSTNDGAAGKPLPHQLIHIASGSILNITEQLAVILEGRLTNLKAIKV